MTNKEDKCDYSKGLIYKIKCLDPEIKDIYVGSTLNEVARRKKHKTNCTSPKNDKYNLRVYQFIRSNGGWENWKLVPIKLYPCNSRLELRMEEERMIEELEEFTTLNRQRAYCSEEEKKEYMKKYREKHKDEIREQRKEYREKHKDEIEEKRKIYFQKPGVKEDRAEKRKIYLQRPGVKEDRAEKHKKYCKKYEEKLKEKRKETYTCPCGSTLTKRSKLRHEKTEKHKDWLKTGEQIKTCKQKVIKTCEQYTYTCPCGSTLTKRSKSRHEDTKKHQNYLKSLE